MPGQHVPQSARPDGQVYTNADVELEIERQRQSSPSPFGGELRSLIEANVGTAHTQSAKAIC
jgi:hypothetical protein